jgi:hypothetical protein
MTAGKIIGIDPGTNDGAYVVWDIASHRVLDHKILPNADLLNFLRDWTEPDVTVCCETIMSYGQRVGVETFETCFFIGRVIEICFLKDIPFHALRRKDVIMVHCASNKANDADVRRAMIAYVGETGNKKKPGPTYGISSHAWSALAIATFLPVQEDTDQKLADLKAIRGINNPKQEGSKA